MNKKTNDGAREALVAKVRNLRVIALDCDGVLFDSLEANVHFYNHILKMIGRAPLRRTSTNSYICSLFASLWSI